MSKFIKLNMIDSMNGGDMLVNVEHIVQVVSFNSGKESRMVLSTGEDFIVDKKFDYLTKLLDLVKTN